MPGRPFPGLEKWGRRENAGVGHAVGPCGMIPPCPEPRYEGQAAGEVVGAVSVMVFVPPAKLAASMSAIRSEPLAAE